MAAMLDPEQYNVCRLKGTERPFPASTTPPRRRHLPLHLLQ
jgi:peptide methionine sulfoxide reductase MsrB